MNNTIENKIDLLSLSYSQLEICIQDMGEPKFRTKQIFDWLHKKQVSSFDEMTNLSKGLRTKLENNCYLHVCDVLAHQTSKLDGTNKFLLKLVDDHCIETVLMEYKHGASLCISTQVGCRQGCKFCASTLGGLVRNLTAGEMLNQIYTVQRIVGKQIGSLVLMGIGEPLDNFENVITFLNLLSSPDGQNLSLRHVSLSTCGLVPQIQQLMKLKLGLTLSVSLHASDNQTRSGIMPINQRHDIEELMTACKEYFATTGRRISYEYALIADVNDTTKDAEGLAKLLRGQNCHINLIPVNPVKERDTKRSSKKSVSQFLDKLTQLGLNATVRRELGGDIDASCGQLRRNHNTKTTG